MKIYTDINQSLLRNPSTADVAKKYDIDAVKQSIRNILMTNYGEKLFNPTFGSDLTSLLFELMTPATKILAQKQIAQAIQLWEPRVQIVSVAIQTDIQTLSVTIEFYVINVNLNIPASVTINLNRVR